VNSGFERLIEGAYPIGREEENATIVFENPKKY
jgi:hypothetical protein